MLRTTRNKSSSLWAFCLLVLPESISEVLQSPFSYRGAALRSKKVEAIAHRTQSLAHAEKSEFQSIVSLHSCLLRTEGIPA